MFFFVYLRFNESVYDTLVYLKKKKYEQHVHSFCYILFVLNVMGWFIMD